MGMVMKPLFDSKKVIIMAYNKAKNFLSGNDDYV